jgi:hypothetical protein
MTTLPVIDELERCKIALQYVAERQADSLTVVLELLVERLDTAIGQIARQLRQGPCPGRCPLQETSSPAPRGVLTLVPGSRVMPHLLATGGTEERTAAEAAPDLDA